MVGALLESRGATQSRVLPVMSLAFVTVSPLKSAMRIPLEARTLLPRRPYKYNGSLACHLIHTRCLCVCARES